MGPHVQHMHMAMAPIPYSLKFGIEGSIHGE